MLVKLKNEIKQYRAKLIAVVVLGFVVLTWSGLLWAPKESEAAINKYINYQGKLLDSSQNPVSDTSYNMTFRIYNDDDAGSVVWDDSYTVDTQDGLFSILLGNSSTGDTLNLNFEDESGYWLSVEVNGDGEMTPRKQIGATAYSFNTDLMDGLEKTQIGSTTAAIVALNSNGNLTVTGNPQGGAVTQGSLYINPAGADVDPNDTIFGVAIGGSEILRLDEDGDLTLAGLVSTTDLYVKHDGDSTYINIEGSSSRVLSGAYLVGVEPTLIGQSNSTNVQFVLEDMSSAIASGASKWTDGGTWIYPTDAGDYGGTGFRIYDDGSLLSDSNLIIDGISAFGTTTDTDNVLSVATSTAQDYGIFITHSGGALFTGLDAPVTGAGLYAQGTYSGASYSNIPILGESTGVTTSGYNVGLYGRGFNSQVGNAGMFGVASSTSASAPSYGGFFSNRTTASNSNSVYGVYSTTDVSGGDLTGTRYGVWSRSGQGATNYGVYGYANSAATTNYGVYAEAYEATTNYGLFASSSGAASVDYGVYATTDGGANDFAIYTPNSGGNVQFGDNLTVLGHTSSSDLYVIHDGDGTSIDIEASGSRTLSGAYLVGVDPTLIGQSNSTNVQFVLEDISGVLTSVSSTVAGLGPSLWTEGASYIYPTSTTADVYLATTQRLGVGLNNPDNRLDVYTNEINVFAAHIFNDSGTQGHGLLVQTDGNGDGTYAIQVQTATSDNSFTITGAGNTTFNDVGKDANFLIESDNNNAMFFVDGGQDAIGVGTTSPSDTVHIIDANSPALHISNGVLDDGMYIGTPDSNEAIFGFGADFAMAGGAVSSYTARETTAGVLRVDNGSLYFSASSSLTVGNTFTPVQRFRISAGGNVAIGDITPRYSLDVVGSAYISNDIYVSSSDLFIGTDTYLSESTGRLDSGAYFIGVDPTNIGQSNSTNVQFVLEDISSVLASVSASSIWSDAGAYIYPTDAANDVAIDVADTLFYADVGLNYIGIGTAPSYHFHVSQSRAAAPVMYVENTFNANNTLRESSAISGISTGNRGDSNPYGVYGQVTAYRYVDRTGNYASAGIKGVATASGSVNTPNSIGVMGRADGNRGIGVWGLQNDASAHGAQTYGVFGYNRGTNYLSAGIGGYSDSGVAARFVDSYTNTNTDLATVQVLAQTSGAKGLLVYGDQADTAYLIRGYLNNNDDATAREITELVARGQKSTAIYAEGETNYTDGSGNQFGIITVLDYTGATAAVGVAVDLDYSAGGTGVHSTVNGISGYGVYALVDDVGSDAGASYGIYAETQTQQGYAVYGYAEDATGINYGIYGVTNSETNGWAGYFTGSGGSTKVFINSTLVLNPVSSAATSTAGSIFFDSDDTWFKGYDGSTWWLFSTSTAQTIWTDRGAYIDPNNATSAFKIADTTGYTAIGSTATTTSDWGLAVRTPYTAVSGGQGGVSSTAVYTGSASGDYSLAAGSFQSGWNGGANNANNQYLFSVYANAKVDNVSSGSLDNVWGVYGRAQVAGGNVSTTYGIFGKAEKSAGNVDTSYGGYLNASGATTNYGAWAQSSGSATTNYGIYAEAASATTNYGVRGQAQGGTTAYGVWGEATTAGTNYAFYSPNGGGYSYFGDHVGIEDTVANDNWILDMGETYTSAASGASFGGVSTTVQYTTGVPAGSINLYGQKSHVVWNGPGGTSSEYVNAVFGGVEIDDVTSNALTSVRGVRGYVNVDSGNVSSTYGVAGLAQDSGGLVNWIYGGHFQAINADTAGYGVYATATGGSPTTNYGTYTEASGGTSNFGVFAKTSGSATTNYGIYAEAGSATTNYGVSGVAQGGTTAYGVWGEATTAGTNWAFYSPGGGGNAAFLDDVYIGATAETITNGDFTLDGDDLFVAGTAGIEGSVYSDGEFVAGTRMAIGDSGSVGYVSSTNSIAFYASNDTSNYIYINTPSGSSEARLYWYPLAAVPASGLRQNSSTGELEYRDEGAGEDGWVPFDNFALAGAGSWTDRGAYIDPNNATGAFKIADTDGYTAIGADATTSDDVILAVADTFSGAGSTGMQAGVSSTVIFTGSIGASPYYLVGSGGQAIWNGAAVGSEGLFGNIGQAIVQNTTSGSLDDVRGNFGHVRVEAGNVSSTYGVYGRSEINGGLVDVGIGVYGKSSGATTNYAFYSDDAGGYSYFGDHVAVEDASVDDDIAFGVLETFTGTPGNKIQGSVSSTAVFTGTSSGSWYYFGSQAFEAKWNGSAGTNLDAIFGSYGRSVVESTNGTSLERAYGIYAQSQVVGGNVSTTYGIFAQSDHPGGLIDISYGGYFKSNNGTMNYGVRGETDGAVTDLSFYAADGEGDAAFLDNLLVGGLAETLTNPGFATSGDDLFVAGMAGIKGDVYTDGQFIAGATTALGDGGSYGFVSSSQSIAIQPDYISSDYIYFTTEVAGPSAQMMWAGYTASNDPGFRINTATNQLEYRDEDELAWTSFDSGITGPSAWTDRGVYIDPNNATGAFKIADTTGHTAIGASATTTADSALGIFEIFTTDPGLAVAYYQGTSSTATWSGGANSGLVAVQGAYNKGIWNGAAGAFAGDFVFGSISEGAKIGGGTANNTGGLYAYGHLDSGTSGRVMGVYARAEALTGTTATNGVAAVVASASGHSGETTYGVYSEAETGSTNYAFYSPDNKGYSYFGDHVAIEDASSTDANFTLGIMETYSGSQTGLQGNVSSTAVFSGTATGNYYFATQGNKAIWSGTAGAGTNMLFSQSDQAIVTGTGGGTLDQVRALFGQAQVTGGNVSTTYGVYGASDHSGGLVDDAYGGYFKATGGSSINYGLKAEAQSGSTQAAGWFLATGGAGDNTYGVWGEANSGDTNIGVYADADGGISSNWAFYTPGDGDNFSYFGDSVNIADASPTTTRMLHIDETWSTGLASTNNYFAAEYAIATYSGNTNNNNLFLYGNRNYAKFTGTPGTGGEILYGTLGYAYPDHSAGTVYSAVGGSFRGGKSGISTGYITQVIGVQGTGYGAYADTAYGGYFSVAGTTSTAYAVYASGDSTAATSHAFYAPNNGYSYSYFGDPIAIEDGTATSTRLIDAAETWTAGLTAGTTNYYGEKIQITNSGNTNDNNLFMYGGRTDVTFSGTAGAGDEDIYGQYVRVDANNNAAMDDATGIVSIVTSSGGTGTVDSMYAVSGLAFDSGTREVYGGYFGALTASEDSYGVYAETSASGSGGNYGLYAKASGAGGTQYAAYFDEGKVHIEGDGTPTASTWAVGDGDLFVQGELEADGGAQFDYPISINKNSSTAVINPQPDDDITLYPALTPYRSTIATYHPTQDTVLRFMNSDSGQDGHVMIEGGRLNVDTPSDFGYTNSKMGLYYEHEGSGDTEAFGIYNQTKHLTTDDVNLVMSGIMNRMNNWGAGVFAAVGTYNDIDYDEQLAGTTYLYGTRNDLTMEAGATSTASFNLIGERTYIDITASTFDQSTIKGNEVYIASDSVAGDPDFVYGYSIDFEASGASVADADFYAFYGDENITTTGETWGLYLAGDDLDIRTTGNELYLSAANSSVNNYIYLNGGTTYAFGWDEAGDAIDWGMTGEDRLMASGTMEILGTTYVQDDIYVGYGSNADNDQIFFDQSASTYIEWDNAGTRFDVTHELRAANLSTTGGWIACNYDGGDGDCAIDFYENGVWWSEQIRWDDGSHGFVLTDDVFFGSAETEAIASTNFAMDDNDVYMPGMLGVDDSVYIDGYLCVDDDGGGASCPAKVEGGIRYDTSQAVFDVAEAYYTPTMLDFGDVTIISDSASTTVDVTGVEYDPRLIGAVSTHPNIVFGINDDLTFSGMGGVAGSEILSANKAAVTIAGRTPVKVNNSNGNIAIGDLITSSAIVGEGMKATKPGTVIGWALEDLGGAATGTIAVYVTPHWNSNGAIANDGAKSTFNDNFAFEPAGTATSSTTEIDSFGLTFRGAGWDTSSSAELILGMTIKNEVSSTDEYGLGFYNDASDKVAFIANNGDLMLGNKLYPSDRGTMQNDYYIFLNTAGPGGKPYMMTNAAGWSTGSYDFAEMFPSEQYLDAGEIVTVAGIDESIVRSSSAYQTSIVGIVSTEPGFIAGDFTTSTYPIALAGRVPTKVTNANGAIEIGDPITTSDIPGVGMKATQAGPIVGYALEYSNSSMDEIIVYVNPSWYGGGAVGYIPGASGGSSGFEPSTSGEVTYLSGALDLQGNDIYGVNHIYGNGYAWEIDENGVLVSRVDTAGGEKPVYGVTTTKAEIIVSGSGMTENGAATIEFSEAVTNMFDSANLSIKVIVTPTSADTPGLAVTAKSSSGFTVEELGGGTGNVTFDWMFMAPRTGYEMELEDYTVNSTTAPEESTGSTSTEPVIPDSGSSSTEPVIPDSGSSSTEPVTP